MSSDGVLNTQRERLRAVLVALTESEGTIVASLPLLNNRKGSNEDTKG